jgi:TonB family protein
VAFERLASTWPFAVAVLLSGTPALAQLVRPEVAWRAPLVYPRGAHGDATVVVDVSVTRGGEVRMVTVRRGREPFASAARDAVLAWRFRPAMDGGVTVDGHVLITVDFHEPPVPAPAEAEPSAPPAAPTPPPTAPARVAPAPAPGPAGAGADHRDPARQSLTRDEARRVAGAFGDPGRAIEALPGVAPVVSGLGFFVVRGAQPGESAYYFDGVRVPMLEHLGPAPIVSGGLVDHIDLYPGAAPARFGRSTGATLSLEAPAPAAAPRLESVGTPYDAGALVEAPFEEGKGSALAAGRYSYTAAMLSPVEPGKRVGYWDYQGRVTWKLGHDDRLVVLALGGRDSVSSTTSSPQTILDTEFHRIDLRYERALGTTGRARVALTLGADSTAHATSTLSDQLAGLRFDAEGNVASNVRLRGGADALFDRYDAGQVATPGWPSSDGIAFLQRQLPTLDPPRDDLSVGAWTDVVWRPLDGVEVTPGLRFDVFTSRFDAGVPPATAPSASDAAVSVDPRLAFRGELSGDVALIAAAGTSHARPTFLVPLPGADGGRLPEGLQSTLQTSLGLEAALPADLTLSLVGFYNQTTRPDAALTCATLRTAGQTDGSCLAASPGAQIVGGELMVRRALTDRLTGWLGYTLSSATREAHPLPSPGSATAIPDEFDRTHVLDLVVSYDLGAGWMASARGLVYSGRPWSQQSDTIPLQPYNSQRLPAFYRADVRLEKRWLYPGGRSLAVVLDWLDVTLSQEAVGVSCTRAGDYPAPDPCTVSTFGPVTIPSVAVEAKL